MPWDSLGNLQKYKQQKKQEIKDKIRTFLERSDIEIDSLMAGLSDELLLANEIGYVNGVWEKVNIQRNSRNDQVKNLRDGLDNSLTNVEMTKRFFIRFSRFLFSGISRGHIESRGGGRVTCIDTPPRPRPSYGALHGQPERPRGYREERST